MLLVNCPIAADPCRAPPRNGQHHEHYETRYRPRSAEILAELVSLRGRRGHAIRSTSGAPKMSTGRSFTLKLDVKKSVISAFVVAKYSPLPEFGTFLVGCCHLIRPDTFRTLFQKRFAVGADHGVHLKFVPSTTFAVRRWQLLRSAWPSPSDERCRPRGSNSPRLSSHWRAWPSCAHFPD